MIPTDIIAAFRKRVATPPNEVARYKYGIRAQDVDRAALRWMEGMEAGILAEREACAKECERIWKEASNERTDSALTSFRQNHIGPGCAASAAAIRGRTAP